MKRIGEVVEIGDAEIDHLLKLRRQQFAETSVPLETPAEAGDAIVNHPIDFHPHRIDAVSQPAGGIEGDVGGREAEVAAALVAAHHDALDEPRASGQSNREPVPRSLRAKEIARHDAAGALQFGVLNMAEFAFSPLETVNSLAGTTKNPYALDRVPAGSSGGTAASVAANFALLGLGSDTGNSIRGPSSHAALVARLQD